MGLWNPIQKSTTGKIASVCYETDRKRGRAANNATRPFLLFHKIIFILGCIQAGDPRVNPRVPPRVLVSGPKPCAGNNWICVYLFVIIIIIYVLINLLNLSYFMETVMGTTFCFSFSRCTLHLILFLIILNKPHCFMLSDNIPSKDCESVKLGGLKNWGMSVCFSLLFLLNHKVL